jgi:hypothetical protein
MHPRQTFFEAFPPSGKCIPLRGGQATPGSLGLHRGFASKLQRSWCIEAPSGASKLFKKCIGPKGPKLPAASGRMHPLPGSLREGIKFE